MRAYSIYLSFYKKNGKIKKYIKPTHIYTVWNHYRINTESISWNIEYIFHTADYPYLKKKDEPIVFPLGPPDKINRFFYLNLFYIPIHSFKYAPTFKDRAEMELPKTNMTALMVGTDTGKYKKQQQMKKRIIWIIEI